MTTYRVIRKSLRDFRPLRYSNRYGHGEGEHVNRGRDTPSFCPTLQVLDMSTLGDAADVNPVIKFLPHTLHVCGRNLITGLTSAASPRVDISSTCKVDINVECLSLCWHAPLRRDHPGYCTVEAGNPVIKFLPHTLHVCGRNLITGLTSAASPRVDISSTCKVRQKLGVSLPLLAYSPSAWPSRLLYRRGRKSRGDLWITLYNTISDFIPVQRIYSLT